MLAWRRKTINRRSPSPAGHSWTSTFNEKHRRMPQKRVPVHQRCNAMYQRRRRSAPKPSHAPLPSHIRNASTKPTTSEAR